MRIGEFFSFFSESPEKQAKALYLQELENWENQGVAREKRAKTVSRIQSFINNPEKKVLSFSNCHLTTLPPLSFIAKRIKFFNLHNNQLRKLPESLGQLINLEMIWGTNHPDLKGIPLSLLDSPNFRHIYSRGTQITKTVEQLKQERQEARAEIAFNLLLTRGVQPRLPESSVSKVNHFIKEPSRYLAELEAWKNQVAEGEKRDEIVSVIKDFIKNLKETDLYLLGPGLTTLPPLGFIAERIKALDLSDNQLQEIPESLRELHNLKSLDLSFNQLKKLPEWLGREFHNLEVLAVTGNPDLKEIPPSLLDSPNFTWLDAIGTQIIKTLEELRAERSVARVL